MERPPVFLGKPGYEEDSTKSWTSAYCRPFQELVVKTSVDDWFNETVPIGVSSVTLDLLRPVR
jgi:hypothetical protein